MIASSHFPIPVPVRFHHFCVRFRVTRRLALPDRVCCRARIIIFAAGGTERRLVLNGLPLPPGTKHISIPTAFLFLVQLWYTIDPKQLRSPLRLRAYRLPCLAANTTGAPNRKDPFVRLKKGGLESQLSECDTDGLSRLTPTTTRTAVVTGGESDVACGGGVRV